MPCGKPYHAQEVKSIQGQNSIPFQVLQTNIKQSNHKTQIYTNKPIVAWHKAWFNLWLEVEKNIRTEEMARIQTTTNDQSIVPIRSEHHYGATDYFQRNQ